MGVKNQFPRKNQIEKLGRFRNRHFCLYFELGCKLGPSEAQAQNTSKNDDFKNGPLFDLIFTWELILDTYRGLGYAQFGWSIFLNRWWLLKRCVLGAEADVSTPDKIVFLKSEGEGTFYAFSQYQIL